MKTNFYKNLRLNSGHKQKEYEHLKIKITDLLTQYKNFVNVIRSNKPHGDATHQQSFSINNGELTQYKNSIQKQSNKIIPDKESHTNPQTIPLNQHEVAVNKFFENLNDITAKTKNFGKKLVDIKKYMEKNKLVKKELYQNNFAEIIEEKMEFLLKNWEKIFEDISGDKEDFKNIFKNSGHQFVGYCLSQRFLEAFNEDGVVKIKAFIDTNSLQKYAQKLAKIVKTNPLDINLYKSTKEVIKNYLDKKCNKFPNVLKDCRAFIENIFQNWKGYCSIDTDNLEFENFEEIHSKNVN
ncbi:unnamed protein product [Meloidogyne enterolobii]|uniref:Uncharacterized protein n=1 Tax=Meloidogyne enterolobii TaxID=390850 RepID=A0ACB0ZKB6_MELEN